MQTARGSEGLHQPGGIGTGRLHETYARSFALNPEHESGYFACVADLLDTPEIKCLASFEQHLDIDRLQRVTSVSYLTFALALKFGLDVRTAARAALLHDLYYYDWRENDWSHRPHGYLHPRFALKNANALCGPLDKKTENAIKRHMWPLTVLPPKYPESLAVSLADKYCAAKELRYSLSKKYRARLDRKIEAYRSC